MKQNLGLIQSMRLLAVLGLVMFGLAAAVPRAEANAVSFNHIYVFGDSLSDTGNYYRLSGLPAAPYVDGRFCNGPLWVEYLAASLRMDYQPADNFAVAGATTGTVNSNGKEYSGLQDEIDSFQAMGAVSEPERALYVVAAGGNDFFVALAAGTRPDVLIGNGVWNTVTAIQRLWASGARHILVMNVADLGVTPAAQSIGFGPLLTQLSAAYDQVLDQALDQLAQAGVSTIRLDAFAVLDEMAYTPADYGFSNVTTPLIMAGSVPNPDEFLFWDGKHPTTGAHKVLAQEALQQLISTFSPSNGQATPDASANALHGLVNASQHKN